MGDSGDRPALVEILELRILDGPNVYFPRPAVKLTLEIPGWLRATAERLERVGASVAVPTTTQAGDRGTDQRERFTARVAVQVARAIATAAGTRLAVRGRVGESGQIVVAYPWRSSGTGEALAKEIAGVMHDLLGTRREPARLIADAAARVQVADPGSPPSVPDPSVPVIAVTGTNGKTTTVRLLAHVLGVGGLSVAYSSTDGVYRDGELVEGGDYSGFAGAAMALSQPGIDAVVLETARGGILLRGIGTAHNDVAVVTNISRDHLGMHGIHTLDQLAEVKATITRITRPEGWAVLNADDPRVLGMRRGATGRPFVYSLDPHHPVIRDVLADGGRAATVLDGTLVVLGPGSRVERLIRLVDVPVTLSGIATHNVRNAMAAVGAALGIGVPSDAVIDGLATFIQTSDTNPGRANVYVLSDRIVVVDYAHNEEGMIGLTEILAGLRRPGAQIWLAFCAAGDRQDEILHALGYRAARGAEHVVVAGLPHYLRGRDADDLASRLRAGAEDGGAIEVPVVPDELHALALMLERSRPGDVLGLTALGQRPEVFERLEELGAVRADPATVAALVRRARR